MLGIYLKGLALGASLIMAIGAQNAFVLSQGVRKKYIIIIPLICSTSDAVLISIGVLGVGQILATNEMVSNIASVGGALFLGWYGIKSFKSFLNPGHMDESHEGPQSLKAAVLFTLAVTLLNPHVYIDTILLLGGISSQFEGNGRYAFGAGAVTASFLWFFSLSLGGRILSPVFKNPLAWKILDLLIAGIMWFIAFTLIKDLILIPFG
jgi:L-lysine exporter family protein LysE/ArgO